MAAESTWVRVESEGELRAGMAVEMRPCNHCGANHAFRLLAHLSADHDFGSHPGHVNDGALWIYVDAPANTAACFCTAIPSGRLYRLDEPSQDVASADKERERVR